MIHAAIIDAHIGPKRQHTDITSLTFRLVFNSSWSIILHFKTHLFFSQVFSSNRIITMSNLGPLFLYWVLTLLLFLPLSSLSHSEAIEALLSRLDTRRAAPSVQESAAKAVLRRLLPTHLDSFQFEIVSKVFFDFRFWVLVCF